MAERVSEDRLRRRMSDSRGGNGTTARLAYLKCGHDGGALMTEELFQLKM